MPNAQTTDVSPQLVMALDYGVKKMGVALGNSVSQDGKPFAIMAMNNGQPDWDNLIGIIQTWQVARLVVGLPLNMDASTSMLAKRAHKFARRLAHRLGEAGTPVDIVLLDERLTSQQARQWALAHQHIKRPTDPIDDVAAWLLLTSYFRAPSAAITLADRAK